MTEHDAIRRDRALACDRNSIKSLSEAITGLQSTDDPSLNALHDELMARYNELESRIVVPPEPRARVMSGKHEGGAAFPMRGYARGMTLRDYFAAKAMQGWLSTEDGPQTPSELAKAAYEVADAMLSAREKRG